MNSSPLKRLLGYAGSRRIFIYLSWILSFLSALLFLVPFWYIWRIIREVLRVSPEYSQAVGIAACGWSAVAFSAAAFLVYILSLLCSHAGAFRVATDIRTELVEKITTLPLGRIEDMGTGKLRSIVSDTSARAETFLAHQKPDQYRAIGTVLGLVALLLAFNWKLALISLIPILIGLAAMTKMAGKEMQEKLGQYNNALSDMSNEAVEYVRGIPVVKTFNQSVFSFRKFKDTIDRYEKWTISYTKELMTPMTIYTLAINSTFVFIIAASALITGNGITSSELLDIIFYIIITPVIPGTLSRLMKLGEESMNVSDALSRIDEVLTAEPVRSGEEHPDTNDTTVAFNDVSFSYDGEKEALCGVSFKVEKGEKVAFVGPSGGGKSTLISLLARFWDTERGTITIGGRDIRGIAKEDLMNTISFVLQGGKLIKGTIRDNVRLGKKTATDEEILSALRRAECMDIIGKFPSGLDTVIGSEGVHLSGGESQRLMIARALLKNSPIIVLDEATAYADPESEVRIQRAVASLKKKRTVIMIAHRLSTISSADRIFVLDNGRIREEGSFESLIKEDGLFSSMWREYQLSCSWKVKEDRKNA